jgi:uncharacterized protein YkwD
MSNVRKNLRTDRHTRHSSPMSFKSGTSRLPLIVVILLIAGLVGLPSSATASTSSTTATARTTSLTPAQFENRLVALTNARRQKIGCPVLRVNSILVGTARLHTKRMVTTGSFSHRVAGEPSLATRITRAGYTGWRQLAENIAWGQRSTPYSIFTMWMNSAGHRANIQNCTLRDIGYGVRYSGGAVWATGDFGRR